MCNFYYCIFKTLKYRYQCDPLSDSLCTVMFFMIYFLWQICFWKLSQYVKLYDVIFWHYTITFLWQSMAILVWLFTIFVNITWCNITNYDILWHARSSHHITYYTITSLFYSFTWSSSSPCWKAPVVLRPMSAGFLRPPSPLRRPPDPLEDMELEELGSRGLLTAGNCGRL